jgi:hypothetical protein
VHVLKLSIGLFLYATNPLIQLFSHDSLSYFVVCLCRHLSSSTFFDSSATNHPGYCLRISHHRVPESLEHQLLLAHQMSGRFPEYRPKRGLHERQVDAGHVSLCTSSVVPAKSF